MENLKLGPEGYTGIALLGTASSSMELAPFRDASWAIWACSPGAYPLCAQNRSDVWFEPHRWLPTSPGKFGAPGTKPWFSPEFHQFLTQHKGPVFMSMAHPSIPSSVAIPYEYLISKYGPYFWTSTLAYMLAMAIETLHPRVQNGEKVRLGLWGVDMCATEEYAYQRPGCQHFIGLAKAMGIDIVLPEESDLMRPTTMYGIGEHNPRHIRMAARIAEVDAVITQCTQSMQATQQRLLTMQGARAEIAYWMTSWSDDVAPYLDQAVSFAGSYTSSPPKEETSGAEAAKKA